MSKLANYSFSLGRVYVLEEEMLSSKDYERLLEAKNLKEKLQILGETHIGDFVTEIEDEADIKQSLDKYLIYLFKLIDELDSKFVSQYFKLPYDVDNLTSIIAGPPFANNLSRLSFVEPSLLKAAIEKQNWPIVNEFFDIDEQKLQILSNAKIDQIEKALQNFFFEQRMNLAKKSGFRSLQEIASLEIDMANIKVWMRKPKDIEQELLKGGHLDKSKFMKTSALDSINYQYSEIAKKIEENTLNDKDFDDYIFSRLEEFTYDPTNPNRLVLFFKAKELEVKNVRSILYSGINNYPRTFVQKDLRYAHA